MMDGTKSSCINHPGVEATVRCKQCGKPVCNACVEQGSTGRFCSPACRQKHEAFMKRSQELDGKARSSVFIKLRSLLGTLIIVTVVLVLLGVAGSFWEIPVLSDIVWKIREILGI